MNIEVWNTLLNAARILQHSKILNLVGSEQGNGYAVVKYQKSCWAMFTLKRNLDQLTKHPLEPKDKRHSFREKGGLLAKWIKTFSLQNVFFVERRKNYVKNSRTRENLNSCT